MCRIPPSPLDGLEPAHVESVGVLCPGWSSCDSRWGDGTHQGDGAASLSGEHRLPLTARAVRLFRLLRLLRASVVVARALQAERNLTSGNALRLVALATLFLTVIAGAVQSTVDTRDFATFWDGVWWAVVTVTTVGYGDLYPHTVPGRIIGIVVMLLGIGFLAVLTATVASNFVQVDQKSQSSQLLETLQRIESDVAELKAQLAARG
jgi:voltage-gated potassium channel